MHSSRMHTIHSSGHISGVYLVPGGVPGPRVSTWSNGVYLVWRGGVPDLGGENAPGEGVYLLPGGYLVLGVYLVGGTSSQGWCTWCGGCTWSGGVPGPRGGVYLVPGAVPDLGGGRSRNTIPIASTQVTIKGIVQYSMRADTQPVGQSDSW